MIEFEIKITSPEGYHDDINFWQASLYEKVKFISASELITHWRSRYKGRPVWGFQDLESVLFREFGVELNLAAPFFAGTWFLPFEVDDVTGVAIKMKFW